MVVRILFLFFAVKFVEMFPSDATRIIELPIVGTQTQNSNVTEKVVIDFYYESLCPYCRNEYITQLAPLVNKMSHHLVLNTYPYGNARRSKENGKTVVECQHGVPECYGNMLHACAIDLLKDFDVYVPYVSCMLALHSDDTAADKCGRKLKVDSKYVKQCAKGPKGYALLIHYGEESDKIKYDGVPWIIINGTPNDSDDLMKAVCEAFKHPPAECQHEIDG